MRRKLAVVGFSAWCKSHICIPFSSKRNTRVYVGLKWVCNCHCYTHVKRYANTMFRRCCKCCINCPFARPCGKYFYLGLSTCCKSHVCSLLSPKRNGRVYVELKWVCNCHCYAYVKCWANTTFHWCCKCCIYTARKTMFYTCVKQAFAFTYTTLFSYRCEALLHHPPI